MKKLPRSDCRSRAGVPPTSRLAAFFWLTSYSEGYYAVEKLAPPCGETSVVAMTEKPLAFLSLVKVLETAVGHRTKYVQLEPFPCTTVLDGQPAIIPIQKAGKIIAQHAGLGDLIFIISATSQAPSTAGHIELRYGAPEVFVEVSRDICPHKDAVLSTLCHEVSHKFLHVNGIRHGTMQVEKEFLTDVAAVFLGMGKIMLNGCECQRSYTKTEAGRTTTITESLRTGYISRECFAFVYRLICEMRRISRDQYLMGLSDAARDAVLACENSFGDWFVPQFHVPEEIEKLTKDLQETVWEGQAEIAERDCMLRRARRTLETTGTCLRESHKPLLEANRKITELKKASENPHLRYLSCIETRECVADLVHGSKHNVEQLSQRWNTVNALAEQADSGASDSEILECPIDGTKLRVPTGRKRLLVTCSVCKYKFVANTALDLPAAQNEGAGSCGILKSLKAAFGRR